MKVQVRQGMKINLDNQIYEGGQEIEITEDTYLNYQHIFEAIENKESKKTKEKETT